MPTFPVFPQNTLMLLLLTESRGEVSDLHSIFRRRALRYFVTFQTFRKLDWSMFIMRVRVNFRSILGVLAGMINP